MVWVRGTRGEPRRVWRRRDGRSVRRHGGGQRIRRHLPERPRKPPTAFNLFVRDFYKTSAARAFPTTREAMAHASIYWRKHPMHRARYLAQAQPEQVRFQASFREYKAKKHLLKRPMNGYLYFMKDFRERERRGRSIVDVANEAGRLWKNMQPAEQAPYEQAAQRARETQSRMLAQLSAGCARIEDFLPRHGGNETQNENEENLEQ